MYRSMARVPQFCRQRSMPPLRLGWRVEMIACTSICATGVEWRRLGLSNEARYLEARLLLRSRYERSVASVETSKCLSSAAG
jgi:hypothetical protein